MPLADRVRRVPITAALVPILAQAMADSATEFVFMNPRSKTPYTDSAAKNAYARAVEKAKINDLHFHDLRLSVLTTYGP